MIERSGTATAARGVRDGMAGRMPPVLHPAGECRSECAATQAISAKRRGLPVSLYLL
jgi:hypothetical protein